MYQVSLNFLLYFQRYAPNKLFIAKIKKGSNPINTGDRVTVLAFCTSTDGPLPMYQVMFYSLAYFYAHALDKLLLQNFKREVTP